MTKRLGQVIAFFYVCLCISISVAAVLIYVKGIVFGFKTGLILGLLSLIPPIGFIEGLLVLLGIL